MRRTFQIGDALAEVEIGTAQGALFQPQALQRAFSPALSLTHEISHRFRCKASTELFLQVDQAPALGVEGDSGDEIF